MKYEFKVPKSLEGERLDRALAMLLDCGRLKARTLIEDGLAFVNSKKITTASQKIQTTDLIQIDFNPEDLAPSIPTADSSVDFNLLYEDAELLVVDKPAGLVVHPGVKNEAHTLVNGLLAKYPEIAEVGESPERPGIVHRLDKDTSGIMLVARTQNSYENLKSAISQREVTRQYGAMCWGNMKNSEGIIDAPIGRSTKDRLKMSIRTNGKPARTHYRLIESLESASLLECTLETGRTHQIRVHLASIGHPVLGDVLYGAQPLKTFPLTRLGLYAKYIEFKHPGTQATMEFSIEMPEILEELKAHLLKIGKP